MLHVLPQPTAAVASKGSKSSKSGYDDTTLPLMEKNQGVSLFVSFFYFIFLITPLLHLVWHVYTVGIALTIFVIVWRWNLVLSGTFVRKHHQFKSDSDLKFIHQCHFSELKNTE